jgi:hypothetical protein
MLCADVIEVCWTDNFGKQQAVGLLEDISESGVCLQMDSSIAIGSEVTWESPREVFNGTVRYCVYREIGYFVGVEFPAGMKWSEEVFQPQHLFDVRRLEPPAESAVASSGLTSDLSI